MMKGKDNYIPKIGERCSISGSNCDDENGYYYSIFEVLWMNEDFILYGNKDCWPNLDKIKNVSIKQVNEATDESE